MCRHHVFAKTSHKDVELAEVGPRFEAKRESAWYITHSDYKLNIFQLMRYGKGQLIKKKQMSSGCSDRICGRPRSVINCRGNSWTETVL